MSNQADHTIVRLRVPPELKKLIEDSADKNNRSQSAEMVARLEKSFEKGNAHETEMYLMNVMVQEQKDQIEKLQSMMKTKNIGEKSLEFFTDLRRYGTVPHGGFGLGFDRFVMLLTGMENIRDVIAFPATYKCAPL
jgi:aspartyl-tRNA synthetase